MQYPVKVGREHERERDRSNVPNIEFNYALTHVQQTLLHQLQGISKTTTITTSARTFSNFPLQVAAKKAKRMLSGKIAKKQADNNSRA